MSSDEPLRKRPKVNHTSQVTSEDFAHLLLDRRWRFVNFPSFPSDNATNPKWTDDLSNFRWRCLLSGCSSKSFDRDLEVLETFARRAWPFVMRNPAEFFYQLYSRLVSLRQHSWLISNYMASLSQYAKRPWLRLCNSDPIWADPYSPPSDVIFFSGPISAVTTDSICVSVALIIRGVVYIVDTETTLCRRLESPSQQVNCIQFSGDDERILSGGADGQICVWNASSGEVVFVAQSPTPGSIVSITSSKNGHRFACLSLGGSITVWETSRGAPLYKIAKCTQALCNHVALSRDGQLLLYVNINRRLLCVDVDKRHPFFDCPPGTMKVERIAGLSTDGKRLVCIGTNCSLKIMNFEHGSFTVSLDGQSFNEKRMSISSCGSRLAFEEQGCLYLWGLKNKAGSQSSERLAKLYNPYIPTGISAHALSSDGRKILAGSREGVLQIWDVGGKDIKINEEKKEEYLRSREELPLKNGSNAQFVLAMSKDARFVITTAEGQRPYLWTTMMEKKTLLLSSLQCAAFRDDGRQLVYVTKDDKVGIAKLRPDGKVNFLGEVKSKCGRQTRVKYTTERDFVVINALWTTYWSVSEKDSVVRMCTKMRTPTNFIRPLDQSLRTYLDERIESDGEGQDGECSAEEHGSGAKLFCEDRYVLFGQQRTILATLPAPLSSASSWVYNTEKHILVVGLVSGAVLRFQVVL